MFASDRDDGWWQLYRRRADGVGGDERVVTSALASVSIPIIVPVLLLLPIPIPIPTVTPIILGSTRCHRPSEKHGDETRCKILHVYSLETV
jgi:hypothetical protein